MKTPKNIDVLFVAGFGPIVRDPAASRKFYSGALGGRARWCEAFCPVAVGAGG